MPRSPKLFALAVMMLATGASRAGWVVTPAADGHGPVLSRALDAAVQYRFECAPDAVAATQTGVTRLMDPDTGRPIDDASTAPLPAKAALMSLYGGTGRSRFVPATATKNPAGGWDLTIRLPKDDPALAAMPKAQSMSLFTTGTTTLVTMDAGARRVWTSFLRECGVKS